MDENLRGVGIHEGIRWRREGGGLLGIFYVIFLSFGIIPVSEGSDEWSETRIYVYMSIHTSVVALAWLLVKHFNSNRDNSDCNIDTNVSAFM